MGWGLEWRVSRLQGLQPSGNGSGSLLGHTTILHGSVLLVVMEGVRHLVLQNKNSQKIKNCSWVLPASAAQSQGPAYPATPTLLGNSRQVRTQRVETLDQPMAPRVEMLDQPWTQR